MDDETTNSESNSAQQLKISAPASLAAILLCQVLAYHDALTWLFVRVVHSSGDAIGMIGVVALVVSLGYWTVSSNRRIHRFSLRPLILLLLIYGLSFLFPAPAIVRAAIAVVSLFLTLQYAVFGHRPPVAWWGMILFALPIVPSLQFYLGYPARLLCASLTVPLLRMNGLAVEREGTYLVWQGQMIQFDAPCSGVTMLWAALLLTFSVAYIKNLKLNSVLIAVAVCILFVLIGNILRAGSLFYLEAGLVSAQADWWHEAVGVVVFIATATGLLATLSRLKSSVPA